MIRNALLVAASAGIASVAVADTRMDIQVSFAGAEQWGSSIQASAGDSIDVRVKVSYVGGAVTPLGFSSVIFQPTISHWSGTGGITDTLAPLINGGVGGQNTSPIGAVNDAPGQYGRVMPFAAYATTTTSFLRGFVHAFPGPAPSPMYLRIAQAQVTSWIGGTGNTSGGSGINMKQLNLESTGRRVLPLPAFSPALTDLVLFKFKITLDADAFDARTMAVDVPLSGIGMQPNPYVGWYANPTEETPSIRDVPVIVPAQIFVNVPAPGAAAVLGIVGLFGARRRRVYAC